MSEVDQREENPEALVVSWIENNLGPVMRLERQGRWRPAWYVDVAKGEETLSLYVRGDRGKGVKTQPQPLDFEYRVLKLFEEKGLKVPHVYGYIDELPAIVMERVPGVPDLKTLENEVARKLVTSQFVDQMILMHKIDPELMEKAGVPRPEGAENRALAYYRRVEPLYLSTKARPEPIIEFIRRWIDRNSPETPDAVYPIAVDAGQFIFDGDKLTAMLDFEFCALGDYHTDLATLRLRNRLEYVGELNEIYRQYGERSGFVVDPNRLHYHTVIKGVLPPMQMAGNLANPIANMDYYQYMVWNAVWLRIALEAIAEMRGWSPEVLATPVESAGSRSKPLIQALIVGVNDEDGVDEIARYRLFRRARNLQYLSRLDRFQQDMERRYLDDVELLLGRKPENWLQADEWLEHFVATASPESDEQLLRIFWRQLLGQCFVLADKSDPINYEMLTTPLEKLAL